MLEHAIKYGEKKGVEVEAYLSLVKKIQISIEKNRIKKMREIEDYGIGIRVICDGALGFSYVSNPSEKKIEECVEHAIKLAEIQSGNYKAFPEVGSSGSYSSYDTKIRDVDENSLTEMAAELLEGATAIAKDVVVNAEIECGILARKIANVSGEVGDKSSYILASAYTIVHSTTPSVGFDIAIDNKLENVKFSEIGKSATEIALSGLNPTALNNKPEKVILSPIASSELFGALVYYVSGMSLKRKQSPLYNRLDEKILDENLILYYDNNAPFGRGFDDEGVPTKPTTFIKDGVLKTYALDMVSAKKLDLKGIGFASRTGYRSRPEALPNAICIDSKVKSSIEDVKNGIVVNYLSGMHTINLETADFSVGTIGPILYVRDGEITNAVKNVMLSGNVIDVFKRVEIGNDPKLLPLFPTLITTIGKVPSIITDRLSVVF